MGSSNNKPTITQQRQDSLLLHLMALETRNDPAKRTFTTTIKYGYSVFTFFFVLPYFYSSFSYPFASWLFFVFGKETMALYYVVSGSIL
jgi:hypothetical protein